mgnify:FL=1
MDYTIDFNPETKLGDKNSDSVFDAVMWCDKEFGRGSYELDNQVPSWRWTLTFHKPEHATHFALRWA